jgi:arginase
MQRLNAASISPDLLEKAQNRVIDAALTFIRERAKFKASS